MEEVGGIRLQGPHCCQLVPSQAAHLTISEPASDQEAWQLEQARVSSNCQPSSDAVDNQAATADRSSNGDQLLAITVGVSTSQAWPMVAECFQAGSTAMNTSPRHWKWARTPLKSQSLSMSLRTELEERGVEEELLHSYLSWSNLHRLTIAVALRIAWQLSCFRNCHPQPSLRDHRTNRPTGQRSNHSYIENWAKTRCQ